MPVAYTKETIEHIRVKAREGWPHGAVAAMLGWEIGQLQRCVEKHQIRFWKIQAVSRTPDPAKAKIRWDGDKAWHGAKSVYLPPAQGRVLNEILKAGPDVIWSAESLGRFAKVAKGQTHAIVSQLRANLECIGLTLTRRTYEIERL